MTALRRCSHALVLGSFMVGLASPARAEDPAPTAQKVSTPAPSDDDRGMNSPGLVAGGAAICVVGLGASGLGIFLTAQGSTLDCVGCKGSSDDAPLVAGGLTVIVLGLGMAATGGTMVVLGWRDEPRPIRVDAVRAGLGGVEMLGSF